MEVWQMTQTEIARVTGAYLALIASCSGSDLDQDHDLDLKVLDQDQIRSDSERKEQDIETRFRDLARKYGIELDDVELSSIERNMVWFENNLDTIRYPAAYIRKMVRDCGRKKRVGFQPPERKADEDSEVEVTEIYGYPVEELDKMFPYFDYSTYTAILDHLPASSRILFRSFEDVRSSRPKLRVFLAEGKKRGVV